MFVYHQFNFKTLESSQIQECFHLHIHINVEYISPATLHCIDSSISHWFKFQFQWTKIQHIDSRIKRTDKKTESGPQSELYSSTTSIWCISPEQKPSMIRPWACELSSSDKRMDIECQIQWHKRAGKLFKYFAKMSTKRENGEGE